MLLCSLEAASRAAKLDGRRPPAFCHGTSSAKASVNRGRATGLDRRAAELYEALPWQALSVIRQTLETRYMGLDTPHVGSRLKNIITCRDRRVAHAHRV